MRRNSERTSTYLMNELDAAAFAKLFLGRVQDLLRDRLLLAAHRIGESSPQRRDRREHGAGDRVEEPQELLAVPHRQCDGQGGESLEPDAGCVGALRRGSARERRGRAGRGEAELPLLVSLPGVVSAVAGVARRTGGAHPRSSRPATGQRVAPLLWHSRSWRRSRSSFSSSAAIVAGARRSTTTSTPSPRTPLKPADGASFPPTPRTGRFATCNPAT